MVATEATNTAGSVSLGMTAAGAILIGVFGEHPLFWLIYLSAAITGTIYNAARGDRRMTAMFILFVVTNTIAFIRTVGVW